MCVVEQGEYLEAIQVGEVHPLTLITESRFQVEITGIQGMNS